MEIVEVEGGKDGLPNRLVVNQMMCYRFSIDSKATLSVRGFGRQVINLILDYTTAFKEGAVLKETVIITAQREISIAMSTSSRQQLNKRDGLAFYYQ